MTKIKYFTLNFGPQHPAAHGVLRLILFMKGETIIKADPHIGLLHRGTEKLLEYKTFTQGIPYFARLDYVSTLSQEHLYCMAIEVFLDKEINYKYSYVRVLFLELTRILNHVLALTTHALDIGAMTPFLWLFEEREKILEFIERVSGTRFHTSYFRPGGVLKDINSLVLSDIKKFLFSFKIRFEEFDGVLINNRIWKQRLCGVGIIDKNSALNYSFSGPMLRSSGVNWDLRKIRAYENYSDFDFYIPTGTTGDCYDRFLIRFEEIKQSISIIEQCLNVVFKNDSLFKITKEDTAYEDYKLNLYTRSDLKLSMEKTIAHFKHYGEGVCLDEENQYLCSETPKGEFGIFLETDNSNKPYRCKIRAPGFYHLQGLDLMIKDHLLADVVAIIGTQDIVFGEVDR